MAKGLAVRSIVTQPDGHIEVSFSSGSPTAPTGLTGSVIYQNEAAMKDAIAEFEASLTDPEFLALHLAITYLKNDGTLANPNQVTNKELRFDAIRGQSFAGRVMTAAALGGWVELPRNEGHFRYIEKDLYGPFALLDKQDFPAVLAHAGSQAYALGAGSVGFETPGVNKNAIDFFLSRGYWIEGFLGTVMTNQPFGKFENYILTSPPYFL